MATRTAFALTAPTTPLFVIAVALAVAALLAHYAGLAIPVISAHVVDTLAIAFAVLTAGVVLKGL